MSTVATILGSDLLALDEIAESVFNLTIRCAKRKAATHTLPVPAFRINGTRKGPLYVRKADIDEYVNEIVTKTAEQHKKMQSVK
ncbi:MAG: pyocin activator PrtN family protein [Burkholderiaceae bacterium]|jgi:hypothetical protein|nr:pyocin activator PrtN family protein [Burkholderiaceae bacterium]